MPIGKRCFHRRGSYDPWKRLPRHSEGYGATSLWLSARYLANFEDALWTTAAAYGDMDTNCAIVGGIVAMYTGRAGLPERWLKCREPLPYWPFLHDG